MNDLPNKFIPLICYRTKNLTKMVGKENLVTFILQLIMVKNNKKLLYHLYYILMSPNEKPFIGSFFDENLTNIKNCCEDFLSQFQKCDIDILKFDGQEMNNTQFKEYLNKWKTI